MACGSTRSTLARCSTDRWDTLEKAFARDKGVTQDRAHELATESIPFGRISNICHRKMAESK